MLFISGTNSPLRTRYNPTMWIIPLLSTPPIFAGSGVLAEEGFYKQLIKFSFMKINLRGQRYLRRFDGRAG